MTHLVFPTAPNAGDLYPDPPFADAEQWQYDGTKWLLVVDRPAAAPAGGGLDGFGDWADVTAVNAAAIKHEYTDANGFDWTAYEWKPSRIPGNVTFTDGVVEILVVGAGGAASPGGNSTGGGGAAIQKHMAVTAGSFMVRCTPAKPNDLNNTQNASTAVMKPGVGTLIAVPAGQCVPPGEQLNMSSFAGAGPSWGFHESSAGAGGEPSPAGPGAGYHSSITGVDVEYGMGANKNTPNPGTWPPGHGGNVRSDAIGGAVVIRVPRKNAKA